MPWSIRLGKRMRRFRSSHFILIALNISSNKVFQYRWREISFDFHQKLFVVFSIFSTSKKKETPNFSMNALCHERGGNGAKRRGRSVPKRWKSNQYLRLETAIEDSPLLPRLETRSMRLEAWGLRLSLDLFFVLKPSPFGVLWEGKEAARTFKKVFDVENRIRIGETRAREK